MITRESTRLVSARRQFRDGVRATQAARKELKKREDDPILLDKIKALKLRLEKVKQESDFRDEYKDDPSRTVSRARHAPPRRRRDSSPSMMKMGGLWSKFEPVRTESRLVHWKRSRRGPNGPKSKQKPPTTSSDGHESRRGRGVAYAIAARRRPFDD